ncbi:MAG TPA: hypothetical protein VM425_11425 [Myxococcota bacterium]|nr:hypothetical protein [Myxococcota bacterium]
MRRVPRWILVFSFLWLTLALAACSGSQNGDDHDGNNVDADGDAGAGDEQQPKTLTWSTNVEVDLEQAGSQLRLAAMPDGQNFAVAYFKNLHCEADGDCPIASMSCTYNACVGECSTPILGGPPTEVLQDQVRYAWSAGDTWQHEDVATVASVMQTGISIAFDGDTPLIAYLGGTPAGGLQVCGGTDAMVARRNGPGSWTEQTAVATSGQAAAGADCPKMQNICDFGDVVGLWSCLAKAPDGTIGLVYRDIHNGYTKEASDSSDLEYAFSSGGGWGNEWIDLARGAASFPSLAFGPDNQPAVAYYTGKYGMINFATHPWADYTEPKACTTNDDCELGQTCSSNFCTCVTDSNCPAPRQCIGNRCSAVIDKIDGLPENSISLAIGQDGRYLVAYFDAEEKNLMIAHSTDGLSWTKGLVDSRESTGMYPSIVVDPQTGQPGIAYYRCSDYSPGDLQCNRNQDALLYTYFTGSYPDELTAQAKWKKSIVSEDSNAFDGMQASAAVLPDGRIGIAYHFTWFDTAAGVTRLNLMFKLGTWE